MSDPDRPERPATSTSAYPCGCRRVFCSTHAPSYLPQDAVPASPAPERVALVERTFYVYVATSWRNEYQPAVVDALQEDGFDVYDFRHPEPGNDGFSWRSVDPEWQSWTPARYLEGLKSPQAEHGSLLDMQALRAADICVMVMPCGMSASLEMGYAVGAGKRVAVYVPALREPDLMIKMADFVTDSLDELRGWLREACLLTASREEPTPP